MQNRLNAKVFSVINMKKLLDILFGKKRIYVDPVLGTFTSGRIKKEDESKIYSWYIEVLFPDAPQEAGIILEGDFNSPSSEQMRFIKNTLDSWDEFFDSMDEIIHKTSSTKWLSKNPKWKTSYYLDTVFPSDDLSISFEFCFSPKSMNKTGGIIVEIEDSKMRKVTLS